jgi:hypothetical protein
MGVELCAEVGDGLTGRRRRIVGVFAPPLLQQRSDTPRPMLTWSSWFNQGRSLIRSPRCCATGRAPCWRKRSRQRRVQAQVDDLLTPINPADIAYRYFLR